MDPIGVEGTELGASRNFWVLLRAFDEQFKMDAALTVALMVLDVLRPGPAPDHDQTTWYDVELGHDDRRKISLLVKVGEVHVFETVVGVV